MSFEIGDKVYCRINELHGIIANKKREVGHDYPITVKFSDGSTEDYTAAGKYLHTHTKTALELTKTAVKVEPEKKYKTSQIDKLGHVVELDDGTKFYQSHSGSILPLNSIKF